MVKKDLTKRVAYLEFVNDQLLSELKSVDELLKAVGFPEGLENVKEAARELQQLQKDAEDEQ